MRIEMKPLKCAVLVVLGVLAATPAVSPAGGEGWMTSYLRATKKAKKTGKPILADFTGSDWCIWCKKLKAEVFDKEEFKTWAAENVILLELDYPNRKPQSPELKSQNKALAKKYKIRGYPTVLLLDGEGKVLGRTGYLKGGPGPWIANAQGFIEARAKANTLKVAASLTAGFSEAKKRNRPLLLVVSASAEDAGSFEKTLAKDPGFVALANLRAVTAHVKLAGKDDNRPDAQRFGELKKRVKIAEDSRYVLVDAAGEKLLFQSPAPKSNKAMIQEIEKALPKIPYGGEWLEDYSRARAIARQEKRLILADFTGSDWCIWCKKAKAEIFSTDEFKSWAAKNVVLLELDFPQKKKLSPELQKQNKALAQKYQIKGFPTMLLLNADGKKVGELGYMKGGPKPFIAKASGFMR